MADVGGRRQGIHEARSCRHRQGRLGIDKAEGRTKHMTRCTRNDSDGLMDVAAAANGRSSMMANEWIRQGVKTNTGRMETDISSGFNKAIIAPVLYPAASLSHLSRCCVVVSSFVGLSWLVLARLESNVVEECLAMQKGADREAP
ncbi:hypothetical protein BDZ97DRAFT_1767763 [Flammula alnicola]|nr:hypothetical protein BDZ97DRAFT_1767763 [Flammula alnicola]